MEKRIGCMMRQASGCKLLPKQRRRGGEVGRGTLVERKRGGWNPANEKN